MSDIQQELQEANDRALRFANRWDSVMVENERMKRTLEQAGYTDHGGEYWKPPLGKRDFQSRVCTWAVECFGEKDTYDRNIRAARFVEEALELVQACNFPRSAVLKVLNYVYDRPVGAVDQEIGGTIVSLSVLCEALAYDMVACGEFELVRILDNIEKIRAKHKDKPNFL